MINRNQTSLAMALAWMMPISAIAARGKYAITAEEHAACDADAVSLCSDVNHDADSLIG